jgi:hypothetical protein
MLRGPGNDVQCMHFLLTNKLGFDAANIVVRRCDTLGARWPGFDATSPCDCLPGWVPRHMTDLTRMRVQVLRDDDLSRGPDFFPTR